MQRMAECEIMADYERTLKKRFLGRAAKVTGPYRENLCKPGGALWEDI